MNAIHARIQLKRKEIESKPWEATEIMTIDVFIRRRILAQECKTLFPFRNLNDITHLILKTPKNCLFEPQKLDSLKLRKR